MVSNTAKHNDGTQLWREKRGHINNREGRGDRRGRGGKGKGGRRGREGKGEGEKKGRRKKGEEQGRQKGKGGKG